MAFFGRIWNVTALSPVNFSSSFPRKQNFFRYFHSQLAVISFHDLVRLKILLFFFYSILFFWQFFHCRWKSHREMMPIQCMQNRANISIPITREKKRFKIPTNSFTISIYLGISFCPNASRALSSYNSKANRKKRSWKCSKDIPHILNSMNDRFVWVCVYLFDRKPKTLWQQQHATYWLKAIGRRNHTNATMITGNNVVPVDDIGFSVSHESQMEGKNGHFCHFALNIEHFLVK